MRCSCPDIGIEFRRVGVSSSVSQCVRSLRDCDLFLRTSRSAPYFVAVGLWVSEAMPHICILSGNAQRFLFSAIHQ